MAAKAETASSPGLERGLAILELLAKHSAGQTLSEICDALSAPSTSVLRIGKTLEQLGYVNRDPVSKRFCLTNRLVQLSQPATRERVLSEVAIEPMREVRRATGETTQLGCLVDCDMVIVEQLIATHPFKYSADIGARCPVYSCAPGKAIAATLPGVDRDALLSRLKLKRFTENTITTKTALRREFASIREHGFAVDRSEGMLGIHCIAAPILDRTGFPIAAITIAGPAERIPEDEFDSVGRIVVAATKSVEREFNS